MRFGDHIVRFNLGGIPAVGNTSTGSIVGLTKEGSSLCDVMFTRNVTEAEVPINCAELVDYFREHEFFEESELKEGHRVRSAYLHVSNRCNLSCVGCYSKDDARNVESDPSLHQLKHAVAVLAELGVEQLVISGGEPFMRSDLPDVARAAKDCGVNRVAVLTNGLLCTPERLTSLVGIVDILSISFDGTSADAPAYIRGEQRFDALIGAIVNAKAAGVHVHILPTLHASNVDDASAYVALAEQLGTTVGFSLLSGSRENLGDLYPSDTCLAHLADVMCSLGQTVDDDVVFNGTRGGLSACAGCGAGKVSVSMAADGSVYPCHMLHYPEFRLGNAYANSADQIREELADFCLPTVDELDSCKDCDKRYLCGGGCRARAFIRYGRMGKKDPYCTFYQHLLHTAVDEFINEQY